MLVANLRVLAPTLHGRQRAAFIAAMREARNLGKARFASAGALINDLEKGAKR